MKIDRIITTIDSHTAGEPTRVITGGLPHIPGETITEKLIYFQSNLDWVRTALIQEPRGHRDMIGAVLLAPTHPEADAGVFFLNPRRYFNLCGHGSIGVATTLVALGLKAAVEPVTQVVLDTPSGLVRVSVRVQNGEILHAGLICVPRFCMRRIYHSPCRGLRRSGWTSPMEGTSTSWWTPPRSSWRSFRGTSTPSSVWLE